MALFYFLLKAGRNTFPDTEGVECANEEGALAHARTVARELMRNREASTAHWRIQVCDDYLRPRHDCLFAEVDQTLEMFPADIREQVAKAARTAAAMNDALQNIDASFADLRSTLGRLDGIISPRSQP